MEYIDEIRKENLEEAIKSLNDTDSIVFSADITTEEALLLQLVKEQNKVSLVCPEAKVYQDFLKAYGTSSGSHIFQGDLDRLSRSEMVISFGVWFQDERAESITLIREILEEKKTHFVYMHPIEDIKLENTLTQFVKYEVGSEEGISALLVYTLLQKKELPEEIKDILEELDIGYLSAESNVGEEELELMYGLIHTTSRISVIIGSDLYTHPKAEQIAKLIALLEVYAGVNVLCLPPAKNALGVALICQLDDVVQGRSVFYQSCKEGTYTNVDKCVFIDSDMQSLEVKSLNSMASALGLPAQTLTQYSKRLPKNKGFKEFNDADLAKNCIYKLTVQEVIKDFTLNEIDDLPVYDGALIYTYQVEDYRTDEHLKRGVLYGSKQFAMATKLQDGDSISFEIEEVKFTRVFKIDTHMKGLIALNPIFDIKLSAYLISLYRFSRLAFENIK